MRATQTRKLAGRANAHSSSSIMARSEPVSISAAVEVRLAAARPFV
jgi:hypothetical protein